MKQSKNSKKNIILVLALILSLLVLAIFYLISTNQLNSHYENNSTNPSIPTQGEIYCSSESRNNNACSGEYNPVCGWFNSEKIQCIIYPCAQTFDNGCLSCLNEDVLYYTNGECPKPGSIDSNLSLNENLKSNEVFVCSDPRPEICTKEYNPVCGKNSEGEAQIFSNGCSACLDNKIESWTEGPC